MLKVYNISHGVQFVLRYCHFKIMCVKLLIHRYVEMSISVCISVHVRSLFLFTDVNITVSSAICLDMSVIMFCYPEKKALLV